jgi:hypothetical protein
MAAFFQEICSLFPLLLSSANDAEFIDHFRPVIERAQRAALLAVKLHEVADELRDWTSRYDYPDGIPLRDFGSVWPGAVRGLPSNVDELERTARLLERLSRSSGEFHPHGRNRGRVRERFASRSIARGALSRFKLSDNAKHGVIAAVISVMFEHSLEPYRVRDWLKADESGEE